MTQDRQPTSDLEKRLAAEGWRFVMNVDPKVDYDALERNPFGGSLIGDPKSRETIRAEYQRRFSEVRVEDAYDSKGRPLKDMVAVYVKDDKKTVKE